MTADDQTKAVIDIATFFLFVGIGAYARAVRSPGIFAAALWWWILIMLLTS